MAVARGHKTPTLVVVTPHLRQHGYGDGRTDECILLKGEDNTRCFCSVQFFCELIFLHRMVYYFCKKEIIPFLCTEFRLFQC